MEPAVPTLPYILATAGHVDHGKSALVRALTGIDPDRLPEEKARGITIELGFANLRVPSPRGIVPSCIYQIGLVDVPGHEDYVRNMVAGVGSVDAALLVVAADDGWMPQTEEHLQILTYLGVTRAVVALTKIDLTADEPTAVARVRERLAGTPLADAPIVSTSVVSGRGLAELTDALADVLSRTPPQPDVGKPRLPVDRVFTLKGIGTVVTGTLVGGSLTRGQSVVIQPQGSPARIRAIQQHNHEVETAMPGSRVALNLPGFFPLATQATRTPQTLEKGNVVTVEAVGPSTLRIDVLLERSGRSTPGAGRPSPSLRDGTTVRVHHGSGSAVARVRLLDGGALAPGGRALARLTLETPILGLIGDRFILRDASQRHTLAGGLILDLDAPVRQTRTPRGASQFALLTARAARPTDVGIFVRSELERDGVTDQEQLLGRSRFGAAEIAVAVRQEVEAHRAVALGNWIAHAGWWSELRARVEAAIDAHHRAHPEQGHLPFTHIGPLVAASIAAPLARQRSAPVAEALIEQLAANGFVRTAGGLRRTSHQLALPPRLQAAGAALRQRLAERPLDPPSRNELCRTDTAQQALRFLIAVGEAVEVGPDIALSAEGYHRAVTLVSNRLRAGQPATVSELKEMLGSSRRVMVPLLEKFDREGITRREGNFRVLRT